jgi:hypothetical protein
VCFERWGEEKISHLRLGPNGEAWLVATNDIGWCPHVVWWCGLFGILPRKKTTLFFKQIAPSSPLLKSFFLKKKTCLKGLTSKNKEKDLLINFIQVMLLHVMATRVLSLLGV